MLSFYLDNKFPISELQDYISHAERLSLEIQKLTEKEESEEEKLQRQEIVHLFETVDGYMEGQADFQKKAYELLIDKDEPPVWFFVNDSIISFIRPRY